MKPNIIIVMTDQQRADLRKGCGYQLDTMPFLDAWAKGGVDFSKAYTPNPTCMPARVSMFTGRYPSCHKVRTNHNVVDAYYTEDLLDIVKKEGYTTALCGKNHSHKNPADFDYSSLNGHLGNENNEDITSDEVFFGKWLTQTNHMEAHEPAPGGLEVQHPYRNVSDALNFIDRTPDNTPFFMWLSFAEPHNPYQVPEPYYDMFPPSSLPKINTGIEDLKGKGYKFQWTRKQWETVMTGDDMDERILRARSNYHGMLRLIDDQFKRLISGLEERKINDNTIVIFISDHGDFVGEYGLIRKGPDLPEVLTRIPMIWKGPGIQSIGIENNSCVNIVDIFPTICNILGTDTPIGVQGKNILPLLKGYIVENGEFDVAYSENGFSGMYWTENDSLTPAEENAMDEKATRFDCLNTWSQCGQVRMIRKGDYKLQIDMMGNGYLYNLEEDKLETTNLWDNKSYQDIQCQLLGVLAAEILKQSDPLPLPHNRYRTKFHPDGYWYQPYNCADPGVRDITL